MRLVNEYTVQMVGHGHIDPVWLWHWQEGYEEVRATFRSALARMEEFPDFKFTASSACFYNWIKESEPELFDAIKKRVTEGRWEITGGFWVEPDCNIPSGESFARHGLYSQRFYEHEFGIRPKVAFNPDSFGHSGTLPQILKQLGIEYYVYMRPSAPEERNYPDGTTFLWESSDGTRVKAVNIQCDYGAEVSHLPNRLKNLIDSPHLNPDQKIVLGFYGVVNHGGGPTITIINKLLAARDRKDMPKIKFSTLEEYFEIVVSELGEDALPIVQDELQYHARGCYSVHSEVKKLNRRIEHAIMNAECFSTIAWLMNLRSYPHQILELAWKDLLFSQFHDILAGTSIQSAYEDVRDQLGAARHRADLTTNIALQSIARDVDTSADGNAILVANPHCWSVTQQVKVMPAVGIELNHPFHIVDKKGNVIPSQQIRHERPGDNKYTFTAEVPSLGYHCYYARSGKGTVDKWLVRGDTQSVPQLTTGPNWLENNWWRIEFDEKDGIISRLYDKTNYQEVLEEGNVLSVLQDGSDTWSHGVESYRTEVGRFGNAHLKLVEYGDVQATIRIISSFGISTCVQEVTLSRETNAIDCKFRINWQGEYQTLKLAYKTCVKDGQATYDIAYGYKERPSDGCEQPGQKWFDLTGNVRGREYGIAILNDSKYGFDTWKNGTMRVTLLRSPAYAHHDPHLYSISDTYPIIDQGWQTVGIQLSPHLGTWKDTSIVKQSWELNAPLFVHLESAHPGMLSQYSSFIGIEAENVLLSVLKQSEEDEEIILRGYETAGCPAQSTLHLPYFHQSFKLDFRPHEIKTIRINPVTWEMHESTLLEE